MGYASDGRCLLSISYVDAIHYDPKIVLVPDVERFLTLLDRRSPQFEHPGLRCAVHPSVIARIGRSRYGSG